MRTVASDAGTPMVGRSLTKLAGAMAMLVLLGVAVVVIGGVLFWHGPAKKVLPCFGCGDQATMVRTTAQQWAPRTTQHFGVSLHGSLRCSIPPKAANPNGQFYPVSCPGMTASGVQVELAGTHAGIEGNNSEYLSGPLTLTVGTVTHHLRCLPSDWEQRYPCGKPS
jgi:hypothetical protein